MPTHILEKVKKLAKIRASVAELESEAIAEKEHAEADRAAKEQEQGSKIKGPKPKVLKGVPDDKAQRNFTDPESRIMKTSKGYEQAYNAQAAVDAEHHVIVAQDVTQEQNDQHQLIRVVDQITANLGQSPEQVSADAGYCSEHNTDALDERGIDGYIATGRQKHGTPCPDAGEEKREDSKTEAMREKLRNGGWESPCRLRKHTVEPVFGNIKEARSFRRFLRRGLDNVKGEWAMLCTVHNLLKLAKETATPAM